MTRQEVEARISALLQAGGFDMTLYDALLPVCEGDIAARLRSGANPETDCPETYALAVSLLMMAEAGGLSPLPQSYTVGDVSLTEGLGAAELRGRAYALLRGYVTPQGFAFLGVPG